MIGGINAGDVDQISVAATTPQFAAAVARGPSLINALRAQLESARAATADPDAPIFHSLPGGLGRLINTLTSRIGSESLMLGTPVREIRAAAAGPHRYEIVTTAGATSCHAAVVATPADVTAQVLGQIAPDSARILRSIDYSSVVLVTLAYDDDAIPMVLADSGFLVPRIEERFITACSWTSTKFSHLRRPGTTLFRVSVGRHDDGRHRGMEDPALLREITADLEHLMGIVNPPSAARISHWPYSLPQYRPGHLDRISEAEIALDLHAPGITLAGAALRGVGIPACIRGGRQAATTAYSLTAAGS